MLVRIWMRLEPIIEVQKYILALWGTYVTPVDNFKVLR
jgi:hypothetical protein